MIPSVRNLPYEVRLKKLALWSLEDRRVRADLTEVFKIVHGLSSVKFDTFFEFSPCGCMDQRSFVEAEVEQEPSKN